MTRVSVLNKLKKYLTGVEICKLEIVSNDKDLLLIMTVSDILRSYDSTQENEAEVELLLTKLISICF